MDIKVLSRSSSVAASLQQETLKALKECGLNVKVWVVDNEDEIAAYGLLSLPVLLLGNAVLVAGRVPCAREIVALLAQRLAGNAAP